jgi:hypothetical protein
MLARRRKKLPNPILRQKSFQINPVSYFFTAYFFYSLTLKSFPKTFLAGIGEDLFSLGEMGGEIGEIGVPSSNVNILLKGKN